MTFYYKNLEFKAINRDEAIRKIQSKYGGNYFDIDEKLESNLSRLFKYERQSFNNL